MISVKESNTCFAGGVALTALSLIIMSSQALPKEQFSPHRTVTAAISLLLACAAGTIATQGEEIEADEIEQKELAKTQRTEQRIMAMESELATVEREYENEDELDELQQDLVKLGTAAPILLQAINMNAAIEAGSMAIHDSYFGKQPEKPPAIEPTKEQPQTPSPLPGLPLYNWDNLPDEAVGVLIVGNSGAAKTSVAVYLLGLFTKNNPAQILALDTHANINTIWRQHGIPVIRDIEAIEEQVKLLIKLLNQRMELTAEELEQEDEIIIVGDELNANLKRFKSSEQMQIALERLGSEGRKFKMTFIGMNQSSNCEDIGISKPMRNNYALILLGASAHSFVETAWKANDTRRKHIESTAYPCIVSGAIRHQIALHPTHHSYTQFKKRGNAPQNLIAINQLPLTIPLAESYFHLYRHKPVAKPQPQINFQIPPQNKGLSPQAQHRLEQIRELRHQGRTTEEIIQQLWGISPDEKERWEYVKGIYFDMVQLLGESETPKTPQNPHNVTTSKESSSQMSQSPEPAEALPKEGARREKEQLYTTSNLTESHLKELILDLKAAGLGRDRIIAALWKVPKGGSRTGKASRWQKARNEYRQIMGE